MKVCWKFILGSDNVRGEGSDQFGGYNDGESIKKRGCVVFGGGVG